ncbi:MAG TPA: PEGA domain-containing protein [Polyangiaceae bacterium]|jgi:hypothetical protein
MSAAIHRCARRFGRAFFACAGLVLATHAASAQPTTAEGETDRAKVLYAAGASAYAAGDFGAAVQALKEAYDLAPRPTVLFSLAQAERQLYTLERQAAVLKDAIGHYRTYVQQTPQGGRRTDAVEVLGELESEAAHLAVESPKAEPARAAATRLMITARAVGAVVSIDGTEHDESPVIEETRPGAHQVVTRAPGYFEDTRTVTSIEGSLVAVEVTLRERAARVELDVPDGTEVLLDGKSMGTAPLDALDVTAGTHLVGFSRAGYVPELRTLAAQRGASIDITTKLRMTAQRKVAYGMLGVGAAGAVAGAVATIVALVAENQARGVAGDTATGNISQSQLDDYNSAIGRRDGWRTVAFTAFGATAGLWLAGGLLYGIDHQQPVDGVDHVGSGTRKVGVTPRGFSLRF